MLLLFVTSLCSQVVGDPHHCPGHPLCHTSFNLESSPSWPGSVLSCSSSVYPKGRGEVVGQASMPLSWFCWYSRLCPRSVASWPSFLGCFPWWLSTMGITLSFLSCVPALMFCAHPHPSMTTRGGARFEMGWAAHIHRGCPSRSFGRFGVRGGFHGFLALVCVRVRVDRQVVGTHGVGQCVQAIFTVFMALGGAH